MLEANPALWLIANSFAVLRLGGYVVKPLDFSAFADVARQCGYYWIAINKMPS